MYHPPQTQNFHFFILLLTLPRFRLQWLAVNQERELIYLCGRRFSKGQVENFLKIFNLDLAGNQKREKLT